jgi:ComF family protein
LNGSGWRRWANHLLDIFFPGDYVCSGCGTTLSPVDDALCPRCIHEAEDVGLELCPLCGFHLPAVGEACPYCDGNPLRAPDRFYCAAFFTGRVQLMVHRLKYDGHRDAARGLGQLLAMKLEVSGDLPAGVELVPVPLFPEREAERGYNQALLVAQEVGARLDLVVQDNLIERIVNTPHQVGSPAGERRRNMAGAFCATREVAGGCFLLIDDVATTGATLEACVAALRHAGAEWVGVAVAGRTPRS